MLLLGVHVSGNGRSCSTDGYIMLAVWWNVKSGRPRKKMCKTVFMTAFQRKLEGDKCGNSAVGTQVTSAKVARNTFLTSSITFPFQVHLFSKRLVISTRRERGWDIAFNLFCMYLSSFHFFSFLLGRWMKVGLS